MARGRGSWSAVRVAKFIILLTAAVGLTTLIVYYSAPRALPWLEASQAINGDSPTRVFRDAGREMLDRRGTLEEGTYERLRETLLREPLAPDPLMYLGLRALGAGDLKRGEQLLLAARARNPRHRLTRVSLVSLYLQTRRPFEAGQEIAVLTRLEPRARQILVPELARLATNPANVPAFVEAIGDDPFMDDLLLYLAEKNASPELLLRLGSRLPPLPNGQFRAWQTAMVRSMVDAGRVQQAYGLWRRFAQVPEGAAPLIYDARFEGLPGGPPFNWDLSPSQHGAAERASGGGLDVRYFGRANATLASQMLMLRPGRYRLSLRVEGNAKGEGAKMVWRVVCRQGNNALAELPVEDVTYTAKELAAAVAVPASGCSEQWLRLEGRAAEFPTMQSARFSELNLQPAGAGR